MTLSFPASNILVEDQILNSSIRRRRECTYTGVFHPFSTTVLKSADLRSIGSIYVNSMTELIILLLAWINYLEQRTSPIWSQRALDKSIPVPVPPFSESSSFQNNGWVVFWYYIVFKALKSCASVKMKSNCDLSWPTEEWRPFLQLAIQLITYTFSSSDCSCFM